MPTTFMDLPPELRNAIYSFIASLVPTLFVDQTEKSSCRTTKDSSFVEGFEIRSKRIYIDCGCKGCSRKVRQPAITQVSRAFRDETISILYGINGFFLGAWSSRWLEAIRAHHKHFDKIKYDSTLLDLQDFLGF